MPTDYVPSDQVLLARLDAELAQARVREEYLQYLHASATFTTSERRSPEEIDVDILRQQALILELEERREAMLAAPAAAAAQLNPPPTLTSAPEAIRAAPALPEYLDTREAAELLGVSVKTLEALRSRGKGPPFIRVGRRVRYPIDGIRGLAK